jgi:hypothetical protein
MKKARKKQLFQSQSLDSLLLLAPLVASLFTLDNVWNHRLGRQTRFVQLFVPLDGGPNTLSTVNQLDITNSRQDKRREHRPETKGAIDGSRTLTSAAAIVVVIAAVTVSVSQ